MATSGSFTLSSNSYFTWTFSWTRTSSVAGTNPSSTISWSLSVKQSKLPMSITVPWKLVVDGEEASGSYYGNNAQTSGYTTTVKTGSKTITHNNNGTKSFIVNLTCGGTFNKTETYVLDQLAVPATLLTATNFNDEENPSITYSNPAGNLLDGLVLTFYSFDGNLLFSKDVPKQATSYTPTLTAAERKAIRQSVKTGTSATINYYLVSVINSAGYSSKLAKTLTLINYEPVLNLENPIDTNNVTKNLTGDDSKFIRYFSNAYFDMGAEARKEATVDSRYVICGSTTLEDYPSNTGTINGIDSNTFYFGMTDSRGYTAKEAIVVDLIPYVKLTASLTLQPLSLSGDLTFIISGNYYNGSFGKKSNSLEFEYGIRENGGDITWRIIQPTVTYGDNRYEATYSISGLNPDSVYTITSNVIDELMSVQSQSESITSTPIFDWGKNDFKHNTPVYLTKNLSLRTVDNDGNDISVLNPCNPQGALVLGWGQYDNANGDTSVYGNSINLTANNEVRINGTPIGGKVLWEGAYYMNGSQTISLSSPISEQINGIVLVFSLYTSGVAQDTSINTFFVSKKEVELLPGAPHTFFMMINSGFSVIGSKYLYIYDDVISGHSTNSTAGSNNNMTFANDRFVLRYVIGV